jgi:uncharacterized protein
MLDQAEFIHTQLQFTANLREPNRFPIPSDVDPERMVLYQDLIFSNILGTLTRAFPILSSTYGPENWEMLVRDFISIHKCKCPTHHEMPEEFLHYLSYVRREAKDPPWTYELAHYEWLELCIDLSPLTLAEVPHDYSGNLLNEIPVVSPLAWIQAYQFPVHTITANNLPEEGIHAPTYLIVYRNWQDLIEFMHINDFTHALLTLLNQDNNTLTGREALSAVANITEHPDPAMVIQGGGLLLENLRERHIILGTKPC